MEKTSNQKVKGLFVDETTLTVVLCDTNTYDTVLKFIELERMEQVLKEELEKVRLKKEQEALE